MVSAELLKNLRCLDRADKLYVMQVLLSDLVQEEAELLKPGMAYPVYSPYEAFEAADTMLEVLKRSQTEDHA